MKKHVMGSLLLSCGLMLGCTSSRTVSVLDITGGRYELTAAYDSLPDTGAEAIVRSYKASIDSVMGMVVGHAAEPLTVNRPESPLSNLVADVLRLSAVRCAGEKADLGMVNIGAVRSDLPAGPVTLCDIYKVLPFDNRVCLLKLTGAQLRRVCEQILLEGSVAVSGGCIVGDGEHRLLSVIVGGEPVVDERTYSVATIDYLAEGNSGLTELKSVADKTFPKGVYLRPLFVEFMKLLESEGNALSVASGKRILIN